MAAPNERTTVPIRITGATTVIMGACRQSEALMNHPVPVRGGELVLAHQSLRRGVGFLGLALPIVVILGKIWLDGGGVLDSISS